jgi:hypothetical protein
MENVVCAMTEFLESSEPAVLRFVDIFVWGEPQNQLQSGVIIPEYSYGVGILINRQKL